MLLKVRVNNYLQRALAFRTLNISAWLPIRTTGTHQQFSLVIMRDPETAVSLQLRASSYAIISREMRKPDMGIQINVRECKIHS